MGQWKMVHCCCGCVATNPIATPRGAGASSCLVPRVPPRAPPCPPSLGILPDPPPPLSVDRPCSALFVGPKEVGPLAGGRLPCSPSSGCVRAKWLGSKGAGRLMQHVQIGHWLLVSVVCQHLRAFTLVEAQAQPVPGQLRVYRAGCGRFCRPRERKRTQRLRWRALG